MPSRRARRASLREGLAYASRGELRVYAFSGTAAKRRVAVLGANPLRAGRSADHPRRSLKRNEGQRLSVERDLTWSNSTLLPPGDALGAVRELRARDGEGVQVMGSASLAAQLIEHDLVDEYRLMIEPVLLGGGKRVFPTCIEPRARSSATTIEACLPS